MKQKPVYTLSIIFIFVLVILGIYHYNVSNEFTIGEYKVLKSSKYHPKGKPFNSLSTIETFEDKEMLLERYGAGAKLLVDLNGFEFVSGAHFEIEDNGIIKQHREYRYVNKDSKDMVIFVNLPISNPIYMEPRHESEKITIENNELLIFKTGDYYTIAMASDVIGRFLGYDGEKDILWLEIETSSKEEALNIVKRLLDQ